MNLWGETKDKLLNVLGDVEAGICIVYECRKRIRRQCCQIGQGQVTDDNMALLTA
jgi:hypothetical protein